MDNKMLSFIGEEQEVIHRVLDTYREIDGCPVCQRDVAEAILVASGSSLNACLLAQGLMRKEKTKLRITVLDPFTFNHYVADSLQKDSRRLVVAVSQTGKSTGVLNAVWAVRGKVWTAALTADPESPLALAANDVFDFCCGVEDIGPKTKGFTASVVALHLLLLKISGSPTERIDGVCDAYRHAAHMLPHRIEAARTWCDAHAEWAKAPSMSVVGYGVGEALAREGALKILETMRIPVMNYGLEEFMHGPHRTLREGSRLVVFALGKEGVKLARGLLDFSESHGCPCLVITDREELAGYHSLGITADEDVSSWMEANVMIQMIGALLPEQIGINPSDPVYASFATTVGTRVF